MPHSLSESWDASARDMLCLVHLNSAFVRRQQFVPDFKGHGVCLRPYHSPSLSPSATKRASMLLSRASRGVSERVYLRSTYVFLSDSVSPSPANQPRGRRHVPLDEPALSPLYVRIPDSLIYEIKKSLGPLGLGLVWMDE